MLVLGTLFAPTVSGVRSRGFLFPPVCFRLVAEPAVAEMAALGL